METKSESTPLFDFFYSIIEKERKEKEFEIGVANAQMEIAKEKDSKIQELQREIDDNRKVIAANGMTIGELRAQIEKYIIELKS